MFMHELILCRIVQCVFVMILYVARLVNIYIQRYITRECNNVISSNSSMSCAIENVVYTFFHNTTTLAIIFLNVKLFVSFF